MIPVRRYWKLLRDYLRPHRAGVAVLGLLVAGGIALQLINPQLMARIIDDAVEGAEASSLVGLALLFMVLAVAQQALALGATWVGQRIGWAATNELRADLADHCVRLDLAFHKQRTPGELIERIDGDVTALSNFFSQFAVHVVGNLVLLVGILVLLILESLWIGLVMIVFAAMSMVAMLRVHHLAVPWWTGMRARSAQFFGFVGEILGGTEEVRANGAAPFFMSRLTQILRGWLPDQVRAGRGWSALWSANVFIFAFSTALIYWLGERLFGAGDLTIGSVYLVFTYVELLRLPMERIRDQMEDLQKAGAGITRVEELFSVSTKVIDSGTDHLPAGPLSVSFDRVTFGYDDEDAGGGPALQEVSFDVGQRVVLGVLGRTGSGKTTVARLLTRLYDPDVGRVVVGGVQLPDVAAGELRRRVRMVSQDVQLFHATLRDNLTLFAESVDDQHLLDVLYRLGLGDWAMSLPSGLDTVLPPGGGGLSAGEGQLLAFARAFLADPGLVVLDEASSRLDPATERLIERAVDQLLAGRTGIIIAHRLATLERADEILIVDRGRVVEHGLRAVLASDPSSQFAHYLRVGLEEVLV
jgi:ATP-binding cassette, subfamily B, bacterial